MTIGEALKNKLGYPVSTGAIEVVCIDNGLSMEANYTGKSKEFDLALAELLLVVLNSPNVSEGGYSISLSERKNILTVRRGILAEYGLDDNAEPTIQGVSIW